MREALLPLARLEHSRETPEHTDLDLRKEVEEEVESRLGEGARTDSDEEEPKGGQRVGAGGLLACAQGPRVTCGFPSTKAEPLAWSTLLPPAVASLGPSEHRRLLGLQGPGGPQPKQVPVLGSTVLHNQLPPPRTHCPAAVSAESKGGGTQEGEQRVRTRGRDGHETPPGFPRREE